MAFRHISETLPGWLVAELEKMAEAVQASAKSGGEQRQQRQRPTALASKAHMHLALVSTRDRPAHAPRATAALGAGRSLRLIVDNDRVGRDARMEGASAPACQRSGKERNAR